MSKKKPAILDAVRNAVICSPKSYIYVAEIANQIDATLGEVQHCFHFLNLEGVLSQAIKPTGVLQAKASKEETEDKYRILRRWSPNGPGPISTESRIS